MWQTTSQCLQERHYTHLTLHLSPRVIPDKGPIPTLCFLRKINKRVVDHVNLPIFMEIRKLENKRNIWMKFCFIWSQYSGENWIYTVVKRHGANFILYVTRIFVLFVFKFCCSYWTFLYNKPNKFYWTGFLFAHFVALQPKHLPTLQIMLIIY